MQDKLPEISVAMCAHNEEEHICESIQSILKQSFENFEFIIVNDGSSDRTENIIRDFKDARIRVIRNEKCQGIARSLNTAMDLARGKYLARMDADDVAYPKRLEIQKAFLDIHPDIVLCGTLVDLQTCWGKEKSKHPITPEGIRNAIFYMCPMTHPTLMGHTWVFRSHPYDPALKMSEDYDLLWKLCFQYPLANIPEALVFYRFSTSWIKKIRTEYWNTKVRWHAWRHYPFPWVKILSFLTPLYNLFIPFQVKSHLNKTCGIPQRFLRASSKKKSPQP